MSTYQIRTAHVDGSRTRRFKSLKGAVTVFERHLGYPIKSAIEEHYAAFIDQHGTVPAIEDVNYLYAVTDIGGVVEFRRLNTPGFEE
jgi:hypothetical protein